MGRKKASFKLIIILAILVASLPLTEKIPVRTLVLKCFLQCAELPEIVVLKGGFLGITPVHRLSKHPGD